MAATLVPSDFFNPAEAREYLAEVAELDGNEEVRYEELPQYGAYLIYSVSGGDTSSLPDLFYVISDLGSCPEYNKVVASVRDGILSLAISQGSTLLLANEYKAPDFTSAEYFIFLSLKSLQLNPEVTTIRFRSELQKEDEMSLYRYFKAVDTV